MTKSQVSATRTRPSTSSTKALDFQKLEERQLLAVTALNFEGKKLIVLANSADTSVTVQEDSTRYFVKDRSTTNVKTWTYSKSSLNTVEFRGGSGDDRFVNWAVNLPVRAFGNGGDDYLEGYNGADYLDGGSGSDTLKGFGGNDNLLGGSGIDYLYGGTGADQLFGGNDKDYLYGNSGNDFLFGGSGDDFLYGHENNDRLNGGLGTDHLYGGSGDDGLMGGGDSVADHFWGESGNDRFLAGPQDSVRDRASADAVIRMRSGSSSWTSDELTAVDEAFAEIQQATGSTRLLKDTTSSSDLIFQKESSSFPYLGLNSTEDIYERYFDWRSLSYKNRYVRTDRLIQIKNFDATDPDSTAEAKDTVIHELAHNWDSGTERQNRGVAASTWNQFTSISAWRSSSSGTHYRSGDGQWYYSKASASGGFLGHLAYSSVLKQNLNYGKWNPREDWATSFESYFRILREEGPFGISGGIGGSQRNSFAQAKLNQVGDFLSRVRNLG